MRISARPQRFAPKKRARVVHFPKPRNGNGISAPAASINDAVWNGLTRDARQPVLQRIREDVVVATLARDPRRMTWCATQLLARAGSIHETGSVVADGVLVTEAELADQDGTAEDAQAERQLPPEWDFPENRAWAVCRITSNAMDAFLALIQDGWEDWLDIRPGRPLVGVFETQKRAVAALQELGYLDRADALERYLRPRQIGDDLPRGITIRDWTPQYGYDPEQHIWRVTNPDRDGDI